MDEADHGQGARVFPDNRNQVHLTLSAGLLPDVKVDGIV